MKKGIVIVVAAIILLSVLAVLPVISEVGDENGTNLSETKTNGNYFQMTIREALISDSCIGTGTTAPVMSEERDENETNVSKTNSAIKAEYTFKKTKGLISGAIIANQTSVSERDLPADIAVTGDLAGNIAFDSDRDGDFEIYVMDADGTNEQQLTHNNAADCCPDWSPDCKKIAFHSTRDGNGEIYVMDADGTNVKKLTSNTAWDGGSAWSPDGSKIAFESDRDGDFEIYVMDADGTNVKKLTSNSVGDGGSAWSPNGSKITFDSDRDGDFEIYVMDADGTNVKKLTSNSVGDGGSAWSPDGSKIAFFSNSDGDSEIYVMDADGTNVVKLTSNTAHDFSPDWCCSAPPELKTITVSPSAVTLNVSDTQQFTATAKDQNGNPMTGIDITWTSSNASVGTVSPASGTTDSGGKATMTFTALAYGTTTVKASSGTVIGTASVTLREKGELQLMEGDVTMDSHVTMADAMFIAQYKAGLRTLNASQLKCADTTDDGDVTMADAMHLAQWKADSDGTLGVLFKPLWESPADDGMLEPVDC